MSEKAAIDFIKSWLASPVGRYRGTPKIFLGELPPDITDEFPIPDDTRVLGTVLQPYKYPRYVIVLNTTRKPQEIVEFYDESMANKGWKKQERKGFPRGGFERVSPAAESRTFCRYEGKGPSLKISTFPLEPGPVVVNLKLNTDPRARECQKDVHEGPRRLESYIPSLDLPGKSIIIGGGGSGGGPKRQRSHMILEVKTEPEKLENHFGKQLLKEGWKLKERGRGAEFAWSLWSFEDPDSDTWKAILTVNNLTENIWATHLQANKVPTA